MDPRDVAQLKRNKTGLPLALHKGKLLEAWRQISNPTLRAKT